MLSAPTPLLDIRFLGTKQRPGSRGTLIGHQLLGSDRGSAWGLLRACLQTRHGTVLDTLLSVVATLDRVEMRTQAALGGEVQGGPHSIATRSSRARRLDWPRGFLFRA